MRITYRVCAFALEYADVCDFVFAFGGETHDPYAAFVCEGDCFEVFVAVRRVEYGEPFLPCEEVEDKDVKSAPGLEEEGISESELVL